MMGEDPAWALGITLSSLESRVSSWSIRDLGGRLEVLAGKGASVYEGEFCFIVFVWSLFITNNGSDFSTNIHLESGW